MTNITIESNEDLDDLRLNVGLAPSSSLNKVILAVCRERQDIGDKRIKFKVSTDFVAQSYYHNPAGFAQNLQSRCPFPKAQAWVQSGYLFFQAGYRKAPRSFRSRAIERVKRHGMFKAPKFQVPITYQRRPILFSNILMAETGHRFAFNAKNSIFTWRKITQR